MRLSPVTFLIPLFAASGCAALIYELVWFQMLQLVIGSTAVSLAVLLASFMGGMCLGSILLPKALSYRANPIQTWSLLELGIGSLGLAVFFVAPWLARFYAAIAPAGFAGILLRGILSAICLLPPTILMGATLPVISRLSSTSSRGASFLGLLYAANTLGAVVGALLAGFVILRLFDSTIATGIAVTINAVIGAIGLNLRWTVSSPAVGSPTPRNTIATTNPHIFLIVAISGFCALGAEVVWTRLLSLMLGGTTYTFSIILAVFLAGLGLGSGIGATMARRLREPYLALAACQLLLAGAIAWAALMLGKSIPFWPINPGLSRSVWYNFQLDLLRSAWAIFPATCLWGATFPLALAAAAEQGGDSQRWVGKLYAANTLGAIVGAVMVSLLLIGAVGTRYTQALLIGLSVTVGMLMYSVSSTSRNRTNLAQVRAIPSTQTFRLTWFWLGAGAIALLLIWTVPAVPWPLVAYGRYLPQKTELGIPLYVGEGINASVAVTELASGVRNFHVSGKIEASTDQQDMRLQRMLAHLPALFHPDPRSILVVGCGAGVTAGSFLVHPGIEHIKICEIEPLIPRVVTRFFGEENYDVIQDPHVSVTYDDARHFVLTTREKFDVITSDPIHPWVKGAATLYTKEYFELCRKHLNPGGLVSQWVPLYESDLATVRSEIATFFDVFPEGTIWSNEDLGAGYDLVLVGQVEPLELDVETLQRRLNRADHKLVLQSLRAVGIRSAFSLTATYAGQARDLKPWLKSAQLNRDNDLRLQYLAGMGLNFNESDTIYAQLSSYRRFPQEIFIGSNTWNDSLRRALEQPKPKGSGDQIAK